MKTQDQTFLVQRLRAAYTQAEKTPDGLAQLQALDRKVRRPANFFAWIFGAVGALVMGCGMSLVMTDLGATLGLGDTMAPGVGIGVAGLVIVVANYPIFRALLAARRKKYAPQVLALSEQLMQG